MSRLLPALLVELNVHLADAGDKDADASLSDQLSTEDVAGWLRKCNSALRVFKARTAAAESVAAAARKRLSSANLRTERPDVEQLLSQLELRERHLQQAADRSRELEAQNSALRQQLCGAAGAHGGGPCPAAEAHQAAAAALAAQLQQLEEANEALWRRTEVLRIAHRDAASAAADVRRELEGVIRQISSGSGMHGRVGAAYSLRRPAGAAWCHGASGAPGAAL
jgi:hypothetical protein